MLDLVQTIPFAFAALFPVLNPIGSSVIILSLVEGCTPSQVNVLAVKIAIYTAILLIVSLLAGTWILRLFGITIPIVLIAGGLVLSQIGWQILSKPSSSKERVDTSSAITPDINDMVFYPLTMPVTAGPGCIAVAIALGAHSTHENIDQTMMNQLGNSIGIILVAVTVYFCYRYTHVIAAKVGSAGTAVLMRMAGFFNLCIGLQLLWHGISYLLKLN